METQLLKLHQQLADLQISAQSRPAYPAAQALGLTTKAHVLKLAAGGEDTAKIARMLRVPEGEVRLLLKVSQIREFMSAPQPQGLPAAATASTRKTRAKVGAAAKPKQRSAAATAQ